MNNQKIALLAIPVFAAIMIGATVTSVYAGSEFRHDIDIKPGSDPNSINVFANGVIPVAILGSESFDVLDVDVSTLTFGPSGATPLHPLALHLENVNGDDFNDLVTHYRTQETGIALGDTEACITGETLGGSPIGGCDDIITSPMGP